jgi:uncharacterized protein
MMNSDSQPTDIPFDKSILSDLVSMKMPFGKFKGRLISNLPEPYLLWFHQNGYPQGRIGILLNTLYEIRLNGLEFLLKELQKKM